MYVLSVLKLVKQGPMFQESSKNFKVFNDVIPPTKLEFWKAKKTYDIQDRGSE
jgi:hypothetical protein